MGLCYIFEGAGSIFSRSNRAQILALHGFSIKPGRVAQLAEHSALNRQVEGSIPSASTIKSTT
jgi:hypothetical protein